MAIDNQQKVCYTTFRYYDRSCIISNRNEKILSDLDFRLSGVDAQEDVVSDSEDRDSVETAESAETKDEKAEREKIYNAKDGDYQPVPEDDVAEDKKELPPRGKIR